MTQRKPSPRYAHLGDGQVGRAQQVLGAFNAAPGEIADRRLAVCGLEAAGEMVFGHAGHRRQPVQVERVAVVAVVAVDVVARTAQCANSAIATECEPDFGTTPD